jgi:serine/threonine protein kinase
MPSDSVNAFLDHAKANRVLSPEQVDQLLRQPDFPQDGVPALGEYLQKRGALTRFQVELVRDRRGEELNFAGYPVKDKAGPCPGGTAYRAEHPSLKTPVVIRRLTPDALGPADNTGGFVARARTAAALAHPNLLAPLDAGFYRDEPYVAVEAPTDVADAEALVGEIGAMPGFLAAEYGRQAAAALRAAHERGLTHGDVRPANFLIGPLVSKPGPDGTPRKRPAPNAAVRLAELGLVPLRPPAEAAPPPLAVLAYLPPERLTQGHPDPRGDLYGLGATLYFLLTGRPPFGGANAEELIAKIRSAEPPALGSLRPDLPADLAALVGRLMAKRPGDRPATAAEADAELAKFVRPAPAPADVPEAEAIPDAEPVHEASADEWGSPDFFSSPAPAATAEGEKKESPRRQKETPTSKLKTRMWLVVGLCLHLTAVLLLVGFLMGWFNSSPKKSEPPPKGKKA